jgi:hypothetical protein
MLRTLRKPISALIPLQGSNMEMETSRKSLVNSEDLRRVISSADATEFASAGSLLHRYVCLTGKDTNRIDKFPK